MPGLILGHGILTKDVPGITFMAFLEMWGCKVVVVILDYKEKFQAEGTADSACAPVSRGQKGYWAE